MASCVRTTLLWLPLAGAIQPTSVTATLPLSLSAEHSPQPAFDNGATPASLTVDLLVESISLGRCPPTSAACVRRAHQARRRCPPRFAGARDVRNRRLSSIIGERRPWTCACPRLGVAHSRCFALRPLALARRLSCNHQLGQINTVGRELRA